MLFDEKFLNRLLEKASHSERLRTNYDLRNNEDEQSQRMLNIFEKGTEIPIHRHCETSETVVILKGELDEIYYDNQGNEIQRFHLNPEKGLYGLQIPAWQWHSLEVIKPSVIIEMKSGKFAPRKEEDILTK